MEAFRHRSPASWWLLLLSLLLWSLGFCSSLSDEVRALLRFRERVEADPYAALSDWVAGEEGADGHCNWAGVECEDGEVTALNLKDLCLKGTLAPELGKLFHMKTLILHNNSFYGIIPGEFGMLQKLEALDLGYNNLSGPIPPDLGNILSLEFLMTRGNHFLDSMPTELHDLIMLSELQVDGRLLPSSRRPITRIGGNATIRKILQLNKSGQGNTGKSIADSTTSPSSRSSGGASPHPPLSPSPAPSPSRYPSSPPSSNPQNPKIHSPTSLEQPRLSPRRNKNAMAPPRKLAPPPHSNRTAANPPASNRTSATPTPKPAPAPPSAKNKSTSVDTLAPESSGKASRAKNIVTLVAIVLGAISLVGLMVFCILCCRCNKVVTVRPWTTGLSGQLQKAFVTGVPLLKQSELETACEDFSNIICSLSDCMLYKGTLSSGVEIAVASTLVTSVKDWSKYSEAQFRKKIDVLSKVNHKNFVNLLGYCEEEEPFTRMMVFEYAPNGTLYEHLHIKEAEDLDWAARLRISMGIAYCLDHMHQLKAPVLLGNLRSSSIYFTDDFAAKVSDFEFWSETTADESASGDSVPLHKNDPNPESILYNFGILLLEILSGKPAFSEEHGPLMDWASDYLRGSKPLRDMVDPNLKSFREEDVSAICEVICCCCDPEPQGRPTMKEVVGRLREITAVPPDAASPKLSPLWWAELEILSTEAN